MNAEQLKNVMITQIPLAAAMQLRVERCDNTCVELSAPLAVNDNHAGTGFGGSLYSLAVLSCWGVLNAALAAEQVPATVVIVDGRVEYVHPVQGDFSASCVLDERGAWLRALKALRLHGKGRIALTSSVVCNGEECMRFSGRFVLLPEGCVA